MNQHTHDPKYHDEDVTEELNKRKDDLEKEIHEYNKEREQIKAMLSRIGGKKYSKTDFIFNIIFLTTIIAFFAVEVTTQILPTYVSLEVGILLVSIKIIWMIHSQHKFNHFEFWILNSIEFRMNNVDKRVRQVEKQLNTLTGEDETAQKTASQQYTDNLSSKAKQKQTQDTNV